MNYNDRIRAYKHAAGFKPEKLTSEEVAKNNAEIESLQKPQTDAALAALLSGSVSGSDEKEETPEFKPFSFDDAPVFKSMHQEDDSQNKQQPEKDDFYQQKETNLNKANQNDELILPSIAPPPKPQLHEEKAEKHNSSLKYDYENSPIVKDISDPEYKPVPYVPQEPEVKNVPFQFQSSQNKSDSNNSDFRSSPEFQAFLKEAGKDTETTKQEQFVQKPNAQPANNTSFREQNPAQNYISQQNIPSHIQAEQFAQNQAFQYQHPPTPNQMQYNVPQPVQNEKPKKQGILSQLFGIKPQQAQTHPASQHTEPQAYQNKQFAQQAYSSPVIQNAYSSNIRTQAYTAEKSRDIQTPIQPSTFKRTAIDTTSENPKPVREFAPPPEENQFDFVAFAAQTGKSAFQPKKFEAKPLENMYKKPDEKNVKQYGTVKTSNAHTGTTATQKTSNISDAKNSNILYKIPSKDSASRRVAKFLLLIGVDEAAKVIALLPQELIDKIIPEIASVRSVDPEEAEHIIAEFSDLYEQAKEGGGVSTARTILEKAFGDTRAQEMMQKVVPFDGGKPFEYLKDLDGEQMTAILKDESAPVIALVLSQIKPAVAATVINQMDEEERKETVRRLAKLSTFPPDILARIDHAMREKAQNLKMPRNNNIDGRNALVNILKKMDSGAEKNILSNLSIVDAELESDLRKRLFTLDDIIYADDRYLQKKLHSMSDADIAILICGKKPEFRKKILSNISKSRGVIVLDEEEARKPIKRRDSDEVTNNFVISLRAAWEAGDLVLDEHNEEDWVK